MHGTMPVGRVPPNLATHQSRRSESSNPRAWCHAKHHRTTGAVSSRSVTKSPRLRKSQALVQSHRDDHDLFPCGKSSPPRAALRSMVRSGFSHGGYVGLLIGQPQRSVLIGRLAESASMSMASERWMQNGTSGCLCALRRAFVPQ